MRKAIATLILLAAIILAFSSCKKNTTANPKLIFKFKFDSTQVRLNNVGQPAAIPSGHAGQSPVFIK